MMTMSRKDTDPIISYILCLAMILSIFGSFFAPVEVFAATGNTQIADLSEWVTVTESAIAINPDDNSTPYLVKVLDDSDPDVDAYNAITGEAIATSTASFGALGYISYVEVDPDDDFHEGSFERQYQHGTKILVATVDENVIDDATSKYAITGVYAFEIEVKVEVDLGSEGFFAWNREDDLLITTPATITINESSTFEGTLIIATDATIKAANSGCTVTTVGTKAALEIVGDADVTISDIRFDNAQRPEKGVVVVETVGDVVLDGVTFDNDSNYKYKRNIYIENSANIIFENDFADMIVVAYGGPELGENNKIVLSKSVANAELLYHVISTDEVYEVMHNDTEDYMYLAKHTHTWNATGLDESKMRVNCENPDCKYASKPFILQVVASDSACGIDHSNFEIKELLANGQEAVLDLFGVENDKFYPEMEPKYFELHGRVPVDMQGETPSKAGVYLLKVLFDGVEIYDDFEIDHAYNGLDELDKDNYTDAGHWRTCLCGETTTTGIEQHVTEYAFDVNGHWVKCDLCNYTTGSASHGAWVQVTGSGVNSGHFNKCGVCGHVAAEVHQHPLVFVTTGATQHWYECPNCSYKTTPEDHSWTVYGSDDDKHWRKCNDCGNVKPESVTSHAIFQLVSIDAYHYYWCPECSHVKGQEGHTSVGALLHNDDNHWYACEEVGCPYPVEITTHAYSIKNDETYHWEQCKCGHKINVTDHAFTVHIYTTEGGITKHIDACSQVGCNATKAALDEDYVVFSQNYTNTHHWFVCSEADCEYTTGKATHTLEATFSGIDGKHWKYCADGCGYTTEKISHDLKWDKNDNGHWQYCATSGCAFRTDVEVHNYDGAQIKYNEHKHWKECTKCGRAGQEEDHEKGSITYEGDYHWYVCNTSGCSVQIDKEAHHDIQTSYGATNHWAECSECHKVIGTKIGHSIDVHEIGSDRQHARECSYCDFYEEVNHVPYTTYSAVEHWSVCDCGFTGPTIEHTMVLTTTGGMVFDGWHYYACEGCAFTTGAGQHYDFDEYQRDENGHWYICTVCSVTYAPASHGAVMTTNAGYHWNTCPDCGYETEYVSHSATILISDHPDYHWHECSVCRTATTPVEHVYNVVEKDGDYHQIKCFGCTSVTGRALHTDFHEIQMTTGSHMYVCSVCGDFTDPENHTYAITYGALSSGALGHWEECENVDCTVTRNAVEHELVLATNAGFHWMKCTNEACGYTTAYGSHMFVPTYSAVNHWYVCDTTYCAITSGEALHDEIVMTGTGVHWIECEAADCAYATAPEPHTTSAWIVVTPAQIGVVGYKHTICTVTGCGVELELATIPALTPAPAGGGGGGGASVAFYNVTSEKTENGTFKVSAKTSAEGETIKITATPSEGYQVGTVTVMDSNNKAVAVTKNADGTYTFKMPASDVKVDVDFAKELAFDQYVSDYVDCKTDASCPMHGYHDVNLESWYHNGVHFCLDNDLMVGYGEGEFRPNSILSRSMITSMLWKLAGSPAAAGDVAFDDVAAGKWYEPSIRWAASMGIVSGYTNGGFGPDDALTREQMVTVLWNFAKKMGYDVSVGEETNILSYDDVAQVAEYAIPAFQWACGAGLVSGKPNADNTGFVLDPTGSGTRAQIATVMMNFIEYYK